MNLLTFSGIVIWILGLAALLSWIGYRSWSLYLKLSHGEQLRKISPFFHFIFWVELPLIALVVFAGMVWIPLLWAAPMLGLVYLFLQRAVEKRFQSNSVIDVAAILFVIVLLFNIALAVIPENTLYPLLRILSGIALYYAVVHWSRNGISLRWLSVLTGFATLGLCLFSLIAVNWTSGKLFFIPLSVYERFSVFVRDTIHPNVLAGSLIAIIPLSLAMLLFGWKKITWLERLLFSFVLIGASISLILTQSRGGLLALSAALLVVFLLRSRKFWFVAFAGVLVGIGLLVFYGQPEFVRRLSDIISIEGLGQREDIWLRAIYMIEDFPITGVGLGHFSDAFRIFYPMSLDPTSHMPHAHNLFLQVGADLGIPGLVVWLSIQLSSLLAAWKVFKLGKNQNQAPFCAFGAGLIGCQMAIILHGLFDSVLWGEIRIAPLVWWVWGMAMAGLKVIRVTDKADYYQEIFNPKEQKDIPEENFSI